jgi:hypothetical protein
VTAWKDCGKAKYLSEQLVSRPRTSQICSRCAVHVTMTFYENVCSAPLGTMMPPQLSGVVVTKVRGEFLTILLQHTRESPTQTTHTMCCDRMTQFSLSLSHTHTQNHALIQWLVAWPFTYLLQVLKMREWPLLTHQHQGL